MPRQKSSLQRLLGRATISKKHKSEVAPVTRPYKLTVFLAPFFVGHKWVHLHLPLHIRDD